VLDLHHRVGALRQWRSSHDFDCGTWGDAMTWTFASRKDFEHLEHRWLVPPGSRYIRMAHRIAVHGGIVLQGNVALGRDLLGHHPMQRLEQRHFFHAHGLDAAQHYLLSFGDPYSLFHIQFLQGTCADIGGVQQARHGLVTVYHTIYGLVSRTVTSGGMGTMAIRGTFCML
jgi:hypothetical protein